VGTAPWRTIAANKDAGIGGEGGDEGAGKFIDHCKCSLIALHGSLLLKC
jgi:hypothetical protein